MRVHWKEMNCDLSISIVNYKTKEYIRNLVSQIKEQIENKLKYEILIFDNSAEDWSDLKCENIIINNSNGVNKFFTYGDAYNTRCASGELILSINPDISLSNNTIFKLINELKSSNLELISPTFLNVDGTLQDSEVYFPSRKTVLRYALGFQKNVREEFNCRSSKQIPVYYGACLLFSRTLIEKIGEKDTNLVQHWDEYEWSYRMFNHGIKAKKSSASVIHIRSVVMGAAENKRLMDKMCGKSFKYLIRKIYGAPFYLLFEISKLISKPIRIFVD